ncbi:MAG: hypothetical protein KDD44_12880, partial [Bdellovibrionales bacterium]|nr:hypothetical protein [Bdellovibrionales bacterium]
MTGMTLMSVSLYQMYQSRLSTEYRPVAAEVNELIALPQVEPLAQSADDVVEVRDARSEAIKQFILRHNPKLLDAEPDFHEKLVAIADQEGLDYR